MENESTSTRRPRRKLRAVAIGGAGALGLTQLLRRRNTTLHAANKALTDTVAAPGTHDEPVIVADDASPAHAGGHRHMAPPERRATTRLAHKAWRRWSPRADHTGHPPRA